MTSLRLPAAMQTSKFRELLRGALTAIVGAGAGYLAIPPAWTSDSLSRWLLEQTFLSAMSAMQPILEIWSRQGDGELMLAALIVGAPAVLIAGTGVGILSTRIVYQRLFIYSVLAWAIYYWSLHTFLIFMLKQGERLSGQPPISSGFLHWKFSLGMTIVSIKYAILFLLIFAVRSAAARFRKRNVPLQPAAEPASGLEH